MTEHTVDGARLHAFMLNQVRNKNLGIVHASIAVNSLLEITIHTDMHGANSHDLLDVFGLTKDDYVTSIEMHHDHADVQRFIDIDGPTVVDRYEYVY